PRFSASALSGANSLKQGGSCGRCWNGDCPGIYMPGPSICAAAPVASPATMSAATGTARICIPSIPVGRLIFVCCRAPPSQVQGGGLGAPPPPIRARTPPKTGKTSKNPPNTPDQGGWKPHPGPDNPACMARYDFRSPRLFVEVALAEGASVPLEAAQVNYLV